MATWLLLCTNTVSGVTGSCDNTCDVPETASQRKKDREQKLAQKNELETHRAELKPSKACSVDATDKAMEL